MNRRCILRHSKSSKQGRCVLPPNGSRGECFLGGANFPAVLAALDEADAYVDSALQTLKRKGLDALACTEMDVVIKALIAGRTSIMELRTSLQTALYENAPLLEVAEPFDLTAADFKFNGALGLESARCYIETALSEICGEEDDVRTSSDKQKLAILRRDLEGMLKKTDQLLADFQASIRPYD